MDWDVNRDSPVKDVEVGDRVTLRCGSGSCDAIVLLPAGWATAHYTGLVEMAAGCDPDLIGRSAQKRFVSFSATNVFAVSRSH